MKGGKRTEKLSITEQAQYRSKSGHQFLEGEDTINPYVSNALDNVYGSIRMIYKIARMNDDYGSVVNAVNRLETNVDLLKQELIRRNK